MVSDFYFLLVLIAISTLKSEIPTETEMSDNNKLKFSILNVHHVQHLSLITPSNHLQIAISSDLQINWSNQQNNTRVGTL